MRMDIKKIPHNTRLFTARIFSEFVGKGLLWFILLFVIVANVYMAYGKYLGALPFINRLSIRQIPNKGDTKNILGTTDTKPKNEVDNAKRNYDFWKTIIRDHPDYRDGYIRAAIHAYELGLFSEAREYVEKAKSIDPNFAGIPTIEAQLKKNN